MNTNTATVIAPDRPLLRFAEIVRSEYCKLVSVRSTYWTLIAALMSNVVLAALAAIFLPSQLNAQEKASFDVTRVSLIGVHLSQIAFGVLGVLVISSEYGTGMIRATLTAVPQRRTMLAAKTIVFAATALVVGLISSYAAYFTFQTFLSDSALQSSIDDPGVLRAITGGGLFLTALGLLGLGLGAVIRVSAGAIAAVLGLLFVPPILLQLLPHTWQTAVAPYIPMFAGSEIYALRPEADRLGTWTGFGLFCSYAAVALGLGFLLINRRDA